MKNLFEKMQKVVDEKVEAYQSDFEIDKKIMLENNCKEYIWIIRDYGTHLSEVKKTPIKNSCDYGTIEYLLMYSRKQIKVVYLVTVKKVGRKYVYGEMEEITLQQLESFHNETILKETVEQRLIQHGGIALSDAQLWSMILEIDEESVIKIVEQIDSYSQEDIYHNLHTMSIEELEACGVKSHSAFKIKAILELSKRCAKHQAVQRYKISSPSAIADIYMEEMRYQKQEHVKVVLLDTKNQIIFDKDITIGSINSSIVHPVDVFRLAIKKNSPNIILLHGHPSGDPKPSQADLQVTKRLKESGDLLGINVLDHIIIGDGRYISLKEEGYL